LKALKNSIEARSPWKFRDDETPQPYGLMTALQVHVTGYVTHVDEKTGRVKGKQVTVRKGAGPETYFRNLGIVRNEQAVANACNQIYNSYLVGQKLNSDGSIYEKDAPKPVAVVFQDRRNDKKQKFQGKPNGTKLVHEERAEMKQESGNAA
jgi:hypothetical protein